MVQRYAPEPPWAFMSRSRASGKILSDAAARSGTAYFGELQKRFPGQLDVSVDQFYRGINVVQPSLIRIEADELTYNLILLSAMSWRSSSSMMERRLQTSLQSGMINIRNIWVCAAITMLKACFRMCTGRAACSAISHPTRWAICMQHSSRTRWSASLRLLGAGGERRFAADQAWLTDKIYKYGKLRTPSELVSTRNRQAA